MDDNTAQRLHAFLCQMAANAAAQCGVAHLLLYDDVLAAMPAALAAAWRNAIVVVSTNAPQAATLRALGYRALVAPNVPMTRLAQLQLALSIAVSQSLIAPGELIAALLGKSASGRADTLMFVQARATTTSGRPGAALATPWVNIAPEVVDRILKLAAALSAEGREGRPIGALFVVGDTAEVLLQTRQLILNPFQGHAEAERNILDPRLEETIKELALMDGAFIVRSDGVMERAGAFVMASTTHPYQLPAGLGARHHSAAVVTARTASMAITVSASTGDVRLFWRGTVIAHLEKPQPIMRLEPADI